MKYSQAPSVVALFLLLTTAVAQPALHAQPHEPMAYPLPVISAAGESGVVSCSGAQLPLRKISAPVLAKLPRVQSRWPREVTLMVQIDFRTADNGQTLGPGLVDAGTIVALVDVTPDHATVLVRGTKVPLPIEQCDLVDRMGGEQAILNLPEDLPKIPPQAVATKKSN